MRPQLALALVLATILPQVAASSVDAQMGRRFPSEKQFVTDPVTGATLSFLTSAPHDDSKIDQFQSTMLSPDGRTVNICVVPVPTAWLERDTSGARST